LQPLTGAAEYAWGARAGLEGGTGRRASSGLRAHYLESVDTLGLYFNRAHSTQYDAGTHYYHSPPASRSNRSRRAILATNHGSSTFQRTWHAWLSKVSNHVHATRRLEASSCAPGAVGVRVTQHGENTTTSSGVAVTVAERARRKSITFPSLPPPLVSTRLTAYLACKGEATETRRGASRSLVEHRLHNLDVESNCPDMATQPEAGILCHWGSLCSAPLWPILGGPCFRHRSQPIARWYRAG